MTRKLMDAMPPQETAPGAGHLPPPVEPRHRKVLVTGATAYVGGRLVPRLLALGHDVRVMVRVASPAYRHRWPGAEIVPADALDREALAGAVEGIDTAFYLIQSMLVRRSSDRAEQLEAAINFRRAAEDAGIRRIILLGRLGEPQDDPCVEKPAEGSVVRELMSGRVPVTLLRTAFVIGAGSASYELILHLVRNLPVIPVPRWARNLCQPVSVQDVIDYLVGVLENNTTSGKSFEIGGSDVLTYEEMLRIQARLLGAKRRFPRCPVSDPRVLAYLASLATPVTGPIIKDLMRCAEAGVVCSNSDIRAFVPFRPVSFEGALLRAMSQEKRDEVQTRWSDAYPLASELAPELEELEEPPRYICRYSLLTRQTPSALFRSLCRIGGREGWFNGNWMWRLRGAFDRLILGVGTARGRRSESDLRLHDVIDFWRVEKLETDRILRLRAEMKVPGRAWLEFVLSPEGQAHRLTVTAYFQPHGLAGMIYWYAFLPSHHYIFTDMLREIDRRS